MNECLQLGLADGFIIGPAIVLKSEMSVNSYENLVYLSTQTYCQPARVSQAEEFAFRTIPDLKERRAYLMEIGHTRV